MLIGDEGESGGRRWEVAGFALGAFSDSLKVRRWDTLILPQGHFAGSPRVSRWVEIFAPRPFFSSPKVSRWVVVGFPNSGFSTSPRVHRWVGSRFAMGTFLDPSGQTLGGKFWGIPIIYQSKGQSLGTPFLPSGHFWSSPKVSHWVMRFGLRPFCIRPSIGAS